MAKPRQLNTLVNVRWEVQPVGFTEEWAPAPPVPGAMRVTKLSEQQMAQLQEQKCPRCEAQGPAVIADRWCRFKHAYRVLRWPCGHETGVSMRGMPDAADGPDLGAWTPAEERQRGPA
jgi:hypothetical protein